MHVKYGALLGWGVVIYAVMFLAWSLFVTYGFVEGVLPRIAGLLTLIAVALSAGRSLRMATWKDILPYAFGWTLIVIAFDMLLSVPFTGWQLFTDWNVWVGYALVVIVPILSPYTRRQPSQKDGI